MNIQWYPGHMARARRDMQESIKLIDLVIEIVDARLPLSSRNPDIDELAGGRGRIIVLNKSDMADPEANSLWNEWFRQKGFYVVEADSRNKSDVKKVIPLVSRAGQAKIERDRKRGIKNRPVRVMVAGIPNVGKSTFINSFAGRSSAKTGNKPGVTRGNQWIKAGKNIELLDTPGLLWPKFDDQEAGIRLAVSGSINDDILDKSELALWLVSYVRENYPDFLEKRYGIRMDEGLIPEHETLLNIAAARNCLTKGGQPDPERAAVLLIDDFRSGRLGRISLEKP